MKKKLNVVYTLQEYDSETDQWTISFGSTRRKATALKWFKEALKLKPPFKTRYRVVRTSSEVVIQGGTK